MNGISYIKLEQRLVLLAWLNSFFGYEHNRDLLADMKKAAEGFDSSGRSYIYHELEARGDTVKIPAADLARYDDNIREHLHAINIRRQEPITLRYFHGDGYGKDFRIFNLKDLPAPMLRQAGETAEDKTETLLLGMGCFTRKLTCTTKRYVSMRCCRTWQRISAREASDDGT